MARTGPTVEEGGDLLVIEDLDVSYGAIQVLFDASLRVPAGGVHALVGRNGVGKTTLLNAIAGLVEWRSGRVLYDGLDLTGVPARSAGQARDHADERRAGRSSPRSRSRRTSGWAPSRSTSTVTSSHERLDAVLDVFPAMQPQARTSPAARSRAASNRWCRWRAP